MIDDFESMSCEDLQAMVDLYNHIMDGSHYQRQIDALRSMEMYGNAAREVESLRRQGVDVS